MKEKKILFVAITLLLIGLTQGATAQNITLETDEIFANGTVSFICTPSDINVTSYFWTFGDGMNETTQNGMATHAFSDEGQFTVTCSASQGNITVEDSLLVDIVLEPVENASLDLTLESQDIKDIILACEATGYTPTTYTWEFGDGVNSTSTNDTINHTYAVAGEYTAMCNASNENISLSDTLQISIPQMNGTNQTNETPEPTGDAEIVIKEWYPQKGAYIFECNTPGFTPASYNWIFGDGMRSPGIPNQDVFHTYLENGDYRVTCEALDADDNVTQTAGLDIEINDIPHQNTCSIFQNSPATCNGGEITQQDFGNSCRTIICMDDSEERRVLGCDKPSANNPLYFELYDLTWDRETDLEICIAGTCIAPEQGWAESDVLVCRAGEQTPPPNDTDSDSVTLCHDPSGRNPETITVNENAVQAHLDHGDTLGACEDGTNGNETNETVATYRVTLENLMIGQPLSPPVAVTHNNNLDAFGVGLQSSEGLAILAVDGDGSLLAEEFQNASGALSVVSLEGPLMSAGMNGSIATFEIEGIPGERLSLASMLICTNDGFAGARSVELPEDSAAYDLAAYDAGVENNTEESEDIPDPCSNLGPFVLDGDPNGNVNNLTNQSIQLHAGIIGNADLDVDEHGWTSVARLTIERVDQGDGDNETEDNETVVTAVNATLSGSQEVPPVTTNASGNATASLDGNVLTVVGEFSNLESNLTDVSGTPAHIHMAPAGSNGPIIFGLTVTSADQRDGNFSGTSILNVSLIDAFLNGNLYVNVHTINNSGGEIRGQIT